MGNSLVRPAGWSQNTRILPAEMDALDAGQARALVNDGTAALTADSVIDNSSFELRIEDASNFEFGGATSWPKLQSRTLSSNACHFDLIWDTSADWTGATGSYGLIASTVTTTVFAHFYLFLPVGMTLTTITLPVLGVTGGTLPGVMPSISLKRFTSTAYGTPDATIGTQADTSASNAAYTVDHAIVISGLSYVVPSTSHHLLEVTGPSGGGTAAGFKIYRPHYSGTLAVLRTA